jgi:GGDEF domain-containing protein
VVGRLGGDEFLVLRRGRGAGDLPAEVAELLRLSIEAGEATVRVGVSAGFATARRGAGIDRDTLIGRADAAMYAVKATQCRRLDDEVRSPPIPAPPVRLS